MLKILGLSLYGRQAASNRYRLEQYQPGLRSAGIEMHVHSLLGDDYVKTTFAGARYPAARLAIAYLNRMRDLIGLHRYDAAMLHLELLPLVPGFMESRLLQVPYIYDFDDAFFLKHTLKRFSPVRTLLKNKYVPVIRRAAAVTAGNEYLLEYAKRWNKNSYLLPTVLETGRYVPAPNKDPRVFTVGWVGSPSTAIYLSELFEPLEELGREAAVRFIAVGGRCPAIPGIEVVNLPWSEATEIDVINTFDVGVMPLFDYEWEKGKCGFKLIQYMACGVPAIASPIGVNAHIVAESSGLLASSSADWLSALQRLYYDGELRANTGAAGRRRVEQHFSLELTVPRLAQIIEDVVRDTRRARKTARPR